MSKMNNSQYFNSKRNSLYILAENNKVKSEAGWERRRIASVKAVTTPLSLAEIDKSVQKALPENRSVIKKLDETASCLEIQSSYSELSCDNEFQKTADRCYQ